MARVIVTPEPPSEDFAWKARLDDLSDGYGHTRAAAMADLYNMTETPDETLAVIAALLREHGQEQAAEIVESLQ